MKAIKFQLSKVRLNGQGYESGANGSYYGSGYTLYRASAEIPVDWAEGIYKDEIMEFRASDRSHAKAIVREKYPTATFSR